jgi:hypothetical protein
MRGHLHMFNNFQVILIPFSHVLKGPSNFFLIPHSLISKNELGACIANKKFPPVTSLTLTRFLLGVLISELYRLATPPSYMELPTCHLTPQNSL